MDEDTKILLNAWRELVIENQRLKDKLTEVSHGSVTQHSHALSTVGTWFFPSRRDRGITVCDLDYKGE